MVIHMVYCMGSVKVWLKTLMFVLLGMFSLSYSQNLRLDAIEVSFWGLTGALIVGYIDYFYYYIYHNTLFVVVGLKKHDNSETESVH